jgi:hypothetical protein
MGRLWNTGREGIPGGRQSKMAAHEKVHWESVEGKVMPGFPNLQGQGRKEEASLQRKLETRIGR